jgi:hypothetical protein
MRKLVREVIELHLPADELARLKKIESLERETCLNVAASWAYSETQ